jgi:dTMP kinase
MYVNEYEVNIRQILKSSSLSPSHGLHHLDDVLRYSLKLHTVYGGDIDIIIASALLHDLGRNDPQYRGQKSASRSAEYAVEILQNISFPPDKVEAVLTAIREHDQPELRPSSLEGRILKDADFLSGFGATGIIRSAMWTAETKGTQKDLLERLEVKMRKRLLSLEFEQSRRFATKEFLFVMMFTERLKSDKNDDLPPVKPYIVFEGISGTGKSTQVNLIADKCEKIGKPSIILKEPTDWFYEQKQMGTSWDKTQLLSLLFCDRMINIKSKIQKAIQMEMIIISDRSFLSTMVYQNDVFTPAEIAFFHTAFPQPTHIFVLDVEPEIAMERITSRKEVQEGGENERLDLLRNDREKYLSLSKYFPFVQVIDTSTTSTSEIHSYVMSQIRDYI